MPLSGCVRFSSCVSHVQANNGKQGCHVSANVQKKFSIVEKNIFLLLFPPSHCDRSSSMSWFCDHGNQANLVKKFFKTRPNVAIYLTVEIILYIVDTLLDFILFICRQTDLGGCRIFGNIPYLATALSGLFAAPPLSMGQCDSCHSVFFLDAV